MGTAEEPWPNHRGQESEESPRNAEAQGDYYDEVAKLVGDLNMRYLRARLPELSRGEAEKLLAEIEVERMPQRGVDFGDLIHMPDPGFFRRRGVPAFTMTGFEGETFDKVESYVAHLRRHLPESYLANRDFREYVETLGQVVAGEVTANDASRRMPNLRRVGGSCPCSRAVRWVVDEPVAP